MNLGNAGFGNAQHLANFFHGQFLIIVEGDHQPFFFGKGINALGNDAFQFIQADLSLRIGL